MCRPVHTAHPPLAVNHFGEGMARIAGLVLPLLLIHACSGQGYRQPFAFQKMQANVSVPPSPGLPRSLSTEGTWLVLFTSPYCRHCAHLVETLRQLDTELSSRDISVVLVSGQEGACFEIPPGVRKKAWSSFCGDEDLLRSWVVDTEPTSYLVRDGKVVWRLLGAAPPEALSAEF